MSQTATKQKLSPFALTVESALKLYQDPEKLGESSPLAAPYLLYPRLEQLETSPVERGKKLQLLLQEAVTQIDGKYKKRYQELIRSYYFEGISQIQICETLHIEKGMFFLGRKAAIEQMATILTQLLQPALQREMPPHAPPRLIGRKQHLERCRQALQESVTIAITGASGVGKTTLAAQVSAQWPQAHTFWYTLRIDFNDHLHSFLFALGHFLKGLGEPLLWQELLAAKQSLQPQPLSDIARHCLYQLHKRQIRPLLCFDEIDLLHSTKDENHAVLIAFLESLLGQVSILLIGQQHTLPAQVLCPLLELNLIEARQMLRVAGLQCTPDELSLIYAYTGGNPRLIELFIALTMYGESTKVILRNIDSAAPLTYFFSKIIQRLTPTECALLKTVAVFRSAAPAEVWENAATGWALARLQERRLLRNDGQGGVTMLPVYQTLLYNLLTAQELTPLHMQAAAIYEDRGSYTAAAYHWLNAGQPEKAILRWHQYRHHEINQGQLRAALDLFSKVDRNALSVAARQRCALICADLSRLIGDTNRALHDMKTVLWSTPLFGCSNHKRRIGQ